MFFENRDYFSYVALCRQEGITVPIIPGLKVLTHQRQLTSLPRSFAITIPPALEKEVSVNPQSALDVGVEWTAEQIRELRAVGVPGVHLYVMQNVKPIHGVMDALR